ncbi:MAG: hypothetical protein R2861_13080 [Desulfobacterales bacterium]
MSSVTRRILKEYTTDDCTTPCQRACPAGINISEYIRLIAEKKYHESVQVIKERNPFPTVIGRICPRPCETNCRRQLIDANPWPLISWKRFVADYEMENGNRVLPYKAPETGRRVAVVGGGVEGLSTAFFTANWDIPTVFEASDRLGGLLRTAIAQYRLPPDVLDWDIAGIVEMGVEHRTGPDPGKKDFTVAALLADAYEVVSCSQRLGRSDRTIERCAAGRNRTHGIFFLIDLLKTGAENKLS